MTSIAGQLAEAGRWTARIVGTLMFLFLLVFLFGEGPPPLWRLSAREQLYALGMGCLFLGLMVSWWREGWGGLVTLAGWGLLGVLAGRPAWNLIFSIPAAIGAVHVACWWRLRDQAPAPDEAAALFKYVSVPLAIFLLLSANEIFGQAPLMTPSGAPPAAMAGTWYDGGSTMLTIAPDGAVSGVLEEQPLRDARLVGNRSWFGRLMHWRTDYLLRGSTPGGGPFLAPVMLRGAELDGSVVFTAAPPAQPLRLHLRKR